jgi:hypothetical protein
LLSTHYRTRPEWASLGERRVSRTAWTMPLSLSILRAAGRLGSGTLVQSSCPSEATISAVKLGQEVGTNPSHGGGFELYWQRM